MASSSVFIAKPKPWIAQLTTANANTDGTTGAVVVLVTGGSAPGSRVDRLRIQAIGNTTAGKIRIFLFDGVSSTKLFKEILVPAVTVSASVAAWDTEATLDVPLPAGFVLIGSTLNSETFNLFPIGGDFT